MDTNTTKEQTLEANHLKDEDPTLIAIKPTQLSKLLREHGPLAMRHITNLLVQEIPEFSQISPSKQRRLIIQAMEQGDEEHQLLFEKVGWGLWQIKPVDPQGSTFEEQRVLMNNLNKRRMDSTATTNDILSSSNTVLKNTTEKQTEGKEKKKSNFMGSGGAGSIIINKQLPKAVFLDENAISSDDDYDDDEEYKLDARRASSTLYSIKRRTSSVVNHPDHGAITPQIKLDPSALLPQKGKPIMKNLRGRRRSSVATNKKKLLLSDGETSNHSPNPRNEAASMGGPALMKVTRSSSVTKDSGLRTTLHYTTDSVHSINSPLSSTSQTSLISSDSLSETHSTADIPPPVSQLSLKSATPERKHQKTELPLELDQLILSNTHSTSSQESDTEEEDWSHLDPQELIHKAHSGENTHEIASLLLSLK